jgi:hypothetical protein
VPKKYYNPKSGWRRERNWDRTFSTCSIVAQRSWAHLRRSLAHQTDGTVFELESRGPITAKHERAHDLYFINGLKSEDAAANRHRRQADTAAAAASSANSQSSPPPTRRLRRDQVGTDDDPR